MHIFFDEVAPFTEDDMKRLLSTRIKSPTAWLAPLTTWQCKCGCHNDPRTTACWHCQAAKP